MAAAGDAGAGRERRRREAAGAFAHDLRTPLAALRMALDLAGEGAGEGLALDGELTALVRSSLADLEGLVDDFHVTSRLERALLEPAIERCEISAVLAEVCALASDLEIDTAAMADAVGRWDRSWLTSAIAVFARTADRTGAADGQVALNVSVEGDAVAIGIRSGTPTAETAPLIASPVVSRRRFGCGRARSAAPARDRLRCGSRIVPRNRAGPRPRTRARAATSRSSRSTG